MSDRWTDQIVAVSVGMQTGVPMNLMSHPGMAKTRIVEGTCESLDAPLEIVMTSLREPPDFLGWPVDGPQGLTFKAPAWATRFSAETFGDRLGAIFFDEANTAPKAVRAAMLRVVCDRVVGECRLGPRVAMLLAMNPPDTSAGGTDLEAALANRMCHLDWRIDIDQWAEALILGFPKPTAVRVPEAWTELLPGQRALVSAFAKVRKGLIYNLPEHDHQRSGAWASLRTWDLATRVLAGAAAVGANDQVKALLVGGLVGEGTAREFLAYVQELDLPDPEGLLKDPKGILTVLPSRGDRVYAVLTSVSAAVLSKSTPKRWIQGVKVLGLAAKRHPDIAAIAIRALVRARPPSIVEEKIPDEIYEFEPILKAAGWSGQ